MTVFDAEEARALAYRQSLQARARAEAERERQLAGNPARRTQLDQNWQPIRDAAVDREAAKHGCDE